MDALHDPTVEEIVVMSSAQIGKTEILLNVIGYHVHQDPSPILMILPTLELAESFSKDRLAPMVRDTPALRGLIADPRSRDSGNTLLHKRFPGGHITLAGANSPASLASRPIRIVLCDEVDRYPVSAGPEGDPVSLARKRAATFWNRKIVLVSTPTIKGASRIEQAWEESDKRRFMLPCPHCGHYQPLVWAHLRWDKDGQGRIGNVRYVCQACDEDIQETEKNRMLQSGRWEATAEFRGVAGFHLNELYSPWRRWEEVVRDFLKAKRSTETLKTWVNTSLGEPWEEQGETVDEGSLFARREQYPAEVPAGALVLTAGVDIQDDRIEMEVVGWGPGEESWGIDYRVLWGDPGQQEIWTMLSDALQQTYEHESGDRLHIAAACIDSGGHHTQHVYEFCRGRQARRIFAVKGLAGAGRPIVSAPMRRRSGRNRRPVELFQVGVDEAKGLIYSRLRLKERGPGYCHFPMRPEYDEEYFAQLTAEKVVTRFHRGFARREWVKTRPRNEALDCRVYALAALYILNPSWDALERRAAERKDGAQSPPAQEPARPRIRRRRAGWVTSWRR
jgi:phage terminase large subunit GpA-like protein